MDEGTVKKDFPIFRNLKQPFIYLDNGATTQKPQVVLDRIARYYEFENSNIHRGNYPLSAENSDRYEHARETVKDWIDADTASEIVFTKGSTEAVNLVASAAFETWIGPGDNVVVTELEHSSNYFPWKHQCEMHGAEFRSVPVNRDGGLDIGRVLELMDDRTKLIAVTAMSNVTGFRPDLKTLIAKAHEKEIPVFVDASQEVVHHSVSVKKMDCDFLCFSGHKLYGPMGTGVLYGKRNYLEEMKPFLYGGDMVEKADGGEITYRRDPGKYEAGTQNIAGVLGLEAAMLYLKEKEFETLLSEEQRLAVCLRDGLRQIRGLHVFEPGVTDGSADKAVTVNSECVSPVIAFESRDLGAYDIGVLLAGRGIAIRCGAHCAYPLLKRMEKESICRISLGIYNTRQDVETVVDALQNICGG